MVAEGLGVDVVHHAEVVDVLQEHRGLGYVDQRRPLGSQNCCQVGQRLADLRLDAGQQNSIGRTQLARDDEPLAGSNDGRVVGDCLGSPAQLKDCPQPQLRLALGLLIANPAPWRPSL